MQNYKYYEYKENNKTETTEILLFLLMYVSAFLKFTAVEYVVSDGFFYSHPDLISASGAAGVLLCLYAPAALAFRKIRGSLLFILSFLLSALAFTDLLYMRFYSDLFTFRSMGLALQLEEVKESVFQLAGAGDLLLFSDLIIFIFYILFIRRKRTEPVFTKTTLKRLLTVLMLMVAGLSLYFLRIHIYSAKVPGVLEAMWDKPAVCNNIGALNYHMTDFIHTVRDRISKRQISQQEINEISMWFRERNKNREKSVVSGVAKGKNLIILQVESLQDFVIGLKKDGVEITPNLNRFAEKSHYYKRTYNQTAAGNSADAEFMANTALYPAGSGVAYTRFAGNSYKALPSLLSASGYTTIAMHADRAGFWNRSNMYRALGFGSFMHKSDYKIDEVIGLGLSDRSFFGQSIEMLKELKQPFYAFVVTLSSHYPFNFPELLAAADFTTPSMTDSLTDNYLRAMRYFDNQFGAFINALDKEGLLDSSVIVVYGDHTALPGGEISRMEKLLNRELKTEGQWRDILRIPLFIRLPGQNRGSVHEEPAGQIDIPRTVCDLLGLEFRTGFGRSLFSEKPEPVIFRNGSCIDGYTYTVPSVNKSFNLRTGEVISSASAADRTDRCREKLSISDKITEYNLAEKIVF